MYYWIWQGLPIVVLVFLITSLGVIGISAPLILAVEINPWWVLLYFAMPIYLIVPCVLIDLFDQQMKRLENL